MDWGSLYGASGIDEVEVEKLTYSYDATKREWREEIAGNNPVLVEHYDDYDDAAIAYEEMGESNAAEDAMEARWWANHYNI